MIIGFGHKAQSGKDTCAQYLVDNYGYRRIGFADALKETCAVAFGVPIAMFYGENKTKVDPYWGVTYRYMLQQIGTNLFRNEYDQDFWVKRAMKNLFPGDKVVFSDMRFPNEVVAINKLLGLAIKIERDLEFRKENLDKEFDFLHASETSLDKFDSWDYSITNNSSLENLYNQIDEIMRKNNINKISERI